MVKKYNSVLFVESPSKIKVYQNALGSDYCIKVFTTKGHLREVIINDFVNYNVIKWEEKVHVKTIIKQLKEINFDNSKNVIIATDADREGEAIGWHLIEILKKYFHYLQIPYRLRCTELNKETIISELNKTLQEKNTLNEFLINAYKARINIDIIIGIQGSQLLWEKIYGCKSLGRVQSISIIKIFELEQLIKNFIGNKKYRLIINYNNIKISKFSINNKIIHDFDNKDEAEKIKTEIEKNIFVFSHTNSKTTYGDSICPLDTSLISSVANTKLSMTINEIYKICQNLYEGIKYNNQIVGVITYMRTDSQNISKEFQNKIKEHISSIFDTNNYKDIVYSNNNVIKQEAHEAIRPTFLMKKEEYNKFIDNLNRKEKKVYQYILFRTLASFMLSPKYKNTEYIFTSLDNKYKIYIYNILLEDYGYLKLLDYYDCHFCYKMLDQINSQENIQQIMQNKFNIKVEVKEIEEKAPERLTESKLIQELKKHNIGRPSTYNYIVNTIKNREYVKMEDKKYYITSLGCILSIFVKQYLHMFINYNFTSDMENSLDKVANGVQDSEELIKNFNSQFNLSIENIKTIERVEIIKNIEKYILENYEKYCLNCKNILKLMFFKYKPYMCCACGNYKPINKIGYKDNQNIPKISEYSKSKQYLKKLKKSKDNK